MKRRILVVGLSVLAVLLLAFVVVYAFGVPQAPRAMAAASATGDAGDDAAGAVASDAASDAAPAPDPASPLAVQIPGCICHSDDPKVVAEHAQYRMNQCYGCHKDGVPGMGQ